MRKGLLAVGGLVMFAQTAHASDKWMNVFVSPGVVSSWSFSPDTASGPGFEISAGYFWWDSKLLPHVGGV